MKKKIAAAGLAAGLVAGTAAGFVLEMSGSAGASSNVSAVVPVADDSTTGSRTPADHAARLQEILQPLVDDSTLTQDQVDKVIAALEAARPDRGHGGARLEVITTVLDMTVEEIRTAISSGQTLAQLAESQGKTGQDLIDALVAELQAHLDEEVASGEHTQEEADAKLAEATTRITEFVNNTPQLPLDGGMGGRGMGGHRGGHRDGMPADTTEG